MKLKNNPPEKLNLRTPLLLQNSTSKSSKCSCSKTFALLTTVLLVAGLVWFFNVSLQKYKANNVRLLLSDKVSKLNNYVRRHIDTNSNQAANNFCSVTSDVYKFDCFPRGNGDQKSCEERNCCWSPNAPNSQVPWCYYPSNYNNYKVINVTKTRNKIVAFFNLTTSTNYKDDVKLLCMDISFQTALRLRIKVMII